MVLLWGRFLRPSARTHSSGIVVSWRHQLLLAPADPVFPNEQPIWRPRRHDSHQSEHSAGAERLRDRLEPCRFVDDRYVSENYRTSTPPCGEQRREQRATTVEALQRAVANPWKITVTVYLIVTASRPCETRLRMLEEPSYADRRARRPKAITTAIAILRSRPFTAVPVAAAA